MCSSAMPPPGKTYFAAKCTTCHSASGDLKGIAARVPDAKTLQNLWVSGGVLPAAWRTGRARAWVERLDRHRHCDAPIRREGRRPLRRIDDFIVTLVQADGTELSFRRDGDRPKVEVRDPLEGHRDLLAVYTDKDMHDVTAYLVTLK